MASESRNARVRLEPSVNKSDRFVTTRSRHDNVVLVQDPQPSRMSRAYACTMTASLASSRLSPCDGSYMSMSAMQMSVCAQLTSSPSDSKSASRCLRMTSSKVINVVLMLRRRVIAVSCRMDVHAHCMNVHVPL